MQEVHLEESPAEQQQLGFVQAKERQREALVQEAVEAVGTFPSSASSPCGLCSPAPMVVSFQIQGLLDISRPSPELRPSPAWQRAGNTQAQGLKASQGETRPRRVAGQGMRVAAHRGPAAALEGEQGCLSSHGYAARPGTQRCYRQQLWGRGKPSE